VTWPLHGAQRGFALLIVLWTLVLLALLGTQLVASGRGDTQLARNLLDAAALESATDGAVQQAIFAMLQPPERRWTADGTVHIVRLGSAVVAIRLEDEAGKVNLNTAPETLLRALLLQIGETPASAASLAAAILDWHSAGKQPRLLGAKVPQYAAAGRHYGPPETDFLSVDELGLVLGMTPALLARLRPHVTVYSDSDPDASTSDPVVAAALGLNPQAPAASTGGLTVASVIAEAKNSGGAGFAERVVARISAQTPRYPYQILARERLTPEPPASAGS
jgi:general secretion pathway protein K